LNNPLNLSDLSGNEYDEYDDRDYPMVDPPHHENNGWDIPWDEIFDFLGDVFDYLFESGGEYEDITNGDLSCDEFLDFYTDCFIDEYEDAYDYLVEMANNWENEIAILQPANENMPDGSLNYLYALPEGYEIDDVIEQYHTHLENDTPLSRDDALFSAEHDIPVNAVHPDGSIWEGYFGNAERDFLEYLVPFGMEGRYDNEWGHLKTY
jgi:proteasome lid subunit RPN8/RPN11